MSEITPNTPNPVREDAYKTELATKLGIDPQYIPASPVWRNEEEIKAIAEMFANMSGGGSGGGVLVVNADAATGTLGKTWQEIHDALAQGILCVTVSAEDDYVAQGQIVSVLASAGTYSVFAISTQGPTLVVLKWITASADGYPVYVNA